ncbi:MAG TPA: LytTR family DNA-binding domain-containing protein [Mucilaginibacter sp.]|nr:LytTR family DNA-binding domain-containing protein [Mucilaginibacter sp.]
MSDIKCIIVEDEPLAVKVLADYISQVPFLELTGTFKDALRATEYLRNNRPNLIFLDIHLPKLKGMAFLKTLAQPPAVIVTTAYHQYAVEGFELNVTDYLLKPFAFDRFLQAVNKVRSPLDQAKEYLFLNVQHKKVKIWFSEILYIESQREYIKIVTAKNSYLTKMGTQEIEALLPQRLFMRVHRSFIVALNKIESYSTGFLEIDGVPVPVGRAYKDNIEKLL